MNLKKLIQKIEKHFSCHGIYIKLKLISVAGNGERFIFQIRLKPGTKENMVFDRASDIRTALQLPLFQPFKNELNICLAVSEKPFTQNSLWKMLTSQTFRDSKDWLPIALGYDMMCKMVFADLGKMPHALYAGATYSGKSVGLICLILSLILKQPVSKVNLLLFDVGANTMEPFEGIPHLSYPIVKETMTGIYVISALVDEMERRIELSHEELRKLPALICIIDEYVSLISNIGDKKLSHYLANSISNLLRRGRHAKIHMVLATQDPTIKNMKVDVGNITARMAFMCAKYHNSITVLGEGGAEKLPGNGAMLYKSKEHPKPIQLQGAYMSSDEIERLVARIKSANYDLSNKFLIPEVDAPDSLTQTDGISDVLPIIDCDEKNEMADIIMWVLERNTVSASQIMRCFSMGNRANGIIDRLFQMGVVSGKDANKPRIVLPQSIEDIPSEVIEMLIKNGIPESEIITALEQRSAT